MLILGNYLSFTNSSVTPRGITCAANVLPGPWAPQWHLCFSTQYPKAYIWTYKLHRALTLFFEDGEAATIDKVHAGLLLLTIASVWHREATCLASRTAVFDHHPAPRNQQCSQPLTQRTCCVLWVWKRAAGEQRMCNFFNMCVSVA